MTELLDMPKDYCCWCYEDGAYTYETTMDDMTRGTTTCTDAAIE